MKYQCGLDDIAPKNWLNQHHLRQIGKTLNTDSVTYIESNTQAKTVKEEVQEVQGRSTRFDMFIQ